MSAPLSKELRSQHGVRMNGRKAGTIPLKIGCCVCTNVCMNARADGKEAVFMITLDANLMKVAAIRSPFIDADRQHDRDCVKHTNPFA